MSETRTDYSAYVTRLTRSARRAALAMLSVSADRKNQALEAVARALEASRDFLQSENRKDLDAARAAGLAGSMIDRLTLSDKTIDAMVSGVRDIVALTDPVGKLEREWTTDGGLHIQKVRQPIGVIVVIYESRPNVTVDAGALCLKSSNAVILRGGKEAFHSNQALAKVLHDALTPTAVDPDVIQVVNTIDRAVVGELLKRDGEVDLVVPRGGYGLIRRVVTESHIPVIKHYEGICHVYIDEECDAALAEKVTVNAKVQRAAICNAVETLLIHKSIADKVLEPVLAALKTHGVEIRGDEEVCRRFPAASPASEEDWSTEYLDLILSVKIVDSLDGAIEHINHYGSKHSDAIITTNEDHARRFCEEVDSAAVFVNCSTRLHDGGVFGMGAEIGISTDKLHARGPMGLEELTSYKYVVRGTGQIRE
ncbi:MAG TPA: glutamate-5-semialdehyde dehydrogenase [Planctomycetota bacterium]|nr:glutamate-5-semialdehyde dehydrogenase [Planctomycetota bacterium]